MATSKAKTAKKPAKVSKPAPVIPQAEDRPPLINSWRISQKAVVTLWKNKLIFSLILLVYFLLDLLLVHSWTGFNVSSIGKTLNPGDSGSGGALGSLGIYSNMVAIATGKAGASSGAYQLFLVVLISLVVIWTLRRVTTPRSKKPTLRGAFYQSTYPLVPFILLLLLMGLQLLPFVIGSVIYSFVVGGGIAVNLFEQLIFLVILLAFASLSVFWLTRTVVALYIVTLPDTPPLAAYRSARELVRGRRLSIARKLLFLPVAMFIVAAIVMVPSIMLWAPLAQVLFYVMTLLAVFVVHAYFYTMYRELLNEA